MKRTGDLTASDGWRFTWDLDSSPQDITLYNHLGHPQWTLSGKIKETQAKEELARFEKDHLDPIQLSF